MEPGRRYKTALEVVGGESVPMSIFFLFFLYWSQYLYHLSLLDDRRVTLSMTCGMDAQHTYHNMFSR